MELDLTGLVLPQRIEVAQRSEDGRTAQFLMGPLERGFGHTLGNTVRRILLSSLPGAAVWAFRMDGVVHEHQTVDGVVEDIHQIIQNLKSLVLVLEEGEESATLQLKAEKAGPVTAELIQAPGTVDIINRDHHLFTLQEDQEVNVTFEIRHGRGFVSADQHEIPEGSPADLVRIDSIFNPVLRANFTVQETRVGQRTDFDRLTMLVETDGSLEPENAVAYAAELARTHLEYMLHFGEPIVVEPPVPGAVKVPAGMQDLFRRPIEDLTELSVRSVNSLKKQSIITLGDLVQHTEDQMLDIENFGQKSLEEIQRFLHEHELHFGMQLEEGEEGDIYLVDGAADGEEPEDGEDEEVAAEETAAAEEEQA